MCEDLDVALGLFDLIGFAREERRSVSERFFFSGASCCLLGNGDAIKDSSFSLISLAKGFLLSDASTMVFAGEFVC